MTYNPDTPIDTQQHDWDCGEQSANWGITALGRHPSDAWLEQAMLADGIESTALGLLDGSGYQLAAWITEQYGDPSEGTPTLTAYNDSPVSFDQVAAVAGTTSVLLGGHRWGSAGHWTGVRSYDPERDLLILANPGGTGPVYGWKSLDRQQFDAISPCSMVVIEPATVPADPPALPPAPPKLTVEQVLAELQAALDVSNEEYAGQGIRARVADIVERMR